jgi:hypothetical protein
MLIFLGLQFQAKLLFRICGIIFGAISFCDFAMADNDDMVMSATNSLATTDSRFGVFDWLDHRSAYNQEFFPQPLLVDDTGLETEGEAEFSSLNTRANAQHSDTYTAGVQKSFGFLTFELGIPYEHESDSDDNVQGIGNVELSARYPLYQFVSANGFFDDTFGMAIEVGIPVNSSVSKNTELDPKVFNDLKLGEHFSLQSVLGYDTLFGGGDNGGLQTFEYGFAFGYAISQSEMPLPGVQQLTPLFELSGETALNKDESSQNSLLGSLGFRLDIKPIGEMQPSLGLGYVFPVDSGARAEVHWGIVTSLTLEF